jgi:dipeptidyl aminopeptidase/acylaminoacyl peptidase
MSSKKSSASPVANSHWLAKRSSLHFWLTLVATISVCVGNMRAEEKPFSARDSIETTIFSDPYTRDPEAVAKISPTGRLAFIVTSKGDLATNTLTSTLHVLSMLEVKEYLNSELIDKPHLREIFHVTRTPQAQQINSYGSLITDARWASDSKSVLALVEGVGGRRHVLRIDVANMRTFDLTPNTDDVVDFSESHGTVAYLVKEAMPSSTTVGVPINSSATVLTGISLFHILFSKEFPDLISYLPKCSLWVHYRGKNLHLDGKGDWAFPSRVTNNLRLAISPDGQSLISARAVPEVSSAWSTYKTARGQLQLPPSRTVADRQGRGLEWLWQYIYIDLKHNAFHPLVDAPSTFFSGYGDVSLAVWSQDNRKVLFTGSYLSLGDKQRSMRELPCAVAIYSVDDRESSCIAGDRFPARNQQLRAVRFGASPDEVITTWSDEDRESNETYVRAGTSWELTGRGGGKETLSSASLPAVFVRQDIDVPPSLWARQAKTDSPKEIWNPNPQLKSFNLGTASVYHWQDASGYIWRGGLVLPQHYMKGCLYPLVIQTHGFHNDHEFLLDGSYTTGFAARPLASAGIVVLQMEDRPDRHVVPPSEEASLTVAGIEAAIDHLDRDGVIDASRVGIIGFSRTHWYVESALIHAPSRYRAAALIDGIDQSYMTYMLFAPDLVGAAREHEDANGGEPFGPGIQRWLKTAVGFNLDKVKTPVRIEALGRLSVLGEWETYSSLYQQGKPVDLIYIPDGQHILQKPQERYASQQGNVDWFRFWLQNYERPNPEDRDQYMRWERLRALQEASTKDTQSTQDGLSKPN